MVDKLAKTILDNIVSKNKYKSHNNCYKDRFNNISTNEENLLISIINSKSMVNSIGKLTIDDLVSSYSKVINKKIENKHSKSNKNVKLSLEQLSNNYIKNINEHKKINIDINSKNQSIKNSKKTISLKELEKMYK